MADFHDVLKKTPGLFFTLILIAFTIGMSITSILDAKQANEKKTKQPNVASKS